jgi:hypothetical protein
VLIVFRCVHTAALIERKSCKLVGEQFREIATGDKAVGSLTAVLQLALATSIINQHEVPLHT